MNLKITLFIFFACPYLFAQVTGTITDKNNDPLPFVNVYLKSTSTGTTTNNDGKYVLSLKKTGNYTIVFQFLGYKTITKKVHVSSFPYQLNITLLEDTYSLNEVVVNTKDNPAHKIIRSAIAHRKINSQKRSNFTVDFYSRGIYRIKNAPEKILGFELGDLGGGLDSTRSGVIYLSETISKITKSKQQFKEQIIASKISGDDNGFSFNQASQVNFNFYKNVVELGENIISPIANYAFNYYKYTLINSYYEGKHLINKIKITPKRVTDNAFNGFIYIIEDTWEIYAVEVYVTGKQIQTPQVEKLYLKQNYSYAIKDSLWSLFSQSIDFKFGIFGINIDGRFTSVYNNYNLKPDFTKKTFTNEVLAFEDKANKKDTLFWNKIRPVPLTLEETKDYQLKDSIKVIRKSKKYLDSIDVKQNKFKIANLLLGYSYWNTYKDWNLTIGSPILNSMFNTVQGWHTNMNVTFSKNDKDQGKSFQLKSKLDYGLSDHQFRISGGVRYQFNNKNKPYIAIDGGRNISQFNHEEPISSIINAASSLLFERNYAKFYDKTFASIAYGAEVINGLELSSSLAYEDRSPLFNTTNYVIFNRDDVVYSSNHPLQPNNYTTGIIDKHQIYKLNISATINFAQKYISLPDRKVNLFSSKYPTLKLQYTKGFGASTATYNYDFAQANISQFIEVGNKGSFTYNFTAGKFLKTNEISFVDYKHFNGNQTHVNLDGSYTNSFYLLPYYDFSSHSEFAELHTQHHFNGYLLRKIPLLNKLQWELVIGAKALFTKENKPYSEYSVGLDNIGFGKFRFLRVDYVRSSFNGKTSNGFMFGLSF